jgi:hypothetical protein
MKGLIKKLERRLRGRPPLAHLSDEQVLGAIERLRRGEPSGVDILPLGMKTGFEHLSDQEILKRLEALRTQLCGGQRFDRTKKEDQ